MTNNNQRDSRWANIPVGFGEQTIGQVGCTISVIGDILDLSPDAVNEALKRVNGFSVNLVIWSKIEEAFPGVKVRRVWAYNNEDVLVNVPNVIVEVPANPIGGRGSHWVRYIGNHQLEDPWTGAVRPTSDFPNPTGYCVIIPQPVVTTPTNPCQEKDDRIQQLDAQIQQLANERDQLKKQLEDLNTKLLLITTAPTPIPANTPVSNPFLGFLKKILV